MFTCCPWPPTHCPHHIHGDASETQIWLCHQWSQEYSCFLLTEQQNLLPWPIDHIDPVSYGSFRLPHPPWTKGTSLCSRHRKTRCQDLCRASSRDRTFHQLTWWMKKLFSFFLACLVLHSHGPYSVHPNAIVENYVQKNICIQSVNRIDINAKCYQRQKHWNLQVPIIQMMNESKIPSQKHALCPWPTWSRVGLLNKVHKVLVSEPIQENQMKCYPLKG